MSVLGFWQINGTDVLGPDYVEYTEIGSPGIRFDAIPVRQGAKGMQWRYQAVPSADMVVLQTIYELVADTQVLVRWYHEYDGWVTGYWKMSEPVIGKRQTYDYLSVTIQFSPVYRGIPAAPAAVAVGSAAPTSRFMPPIISAFAVEPTTKGVGQARIISGGIVSNTIGGLGVPSSSIDIGIATIGDA